MTALSWRSRSAAVRAVLVPAVLLGLLAIVGVAGFTPAQAATHTVTLSNRGPSPTAITVPRGDTVTFTNADSVSHTITHTSGAWSFTATIAAGRSAVTPPFGSPDTYGYSDNFNVAVVPQTVNGTITVSASPPPTASPTPPPKPKPSASPKPTTSPKPSPTTSPTPSPTPSPSASVTGVAISPGLSVGGLPTMSPTANGPTPNIAPTETGPPVGAPVSLTYGGKAAIVQHSSHRYGLPAALGLLAAFGVLSLLVRVLLAEPAARTRRTPEAGTATEG